VEPLESSSTPEAASRVRGVAPWVVGWDQPWYLARFNRNGRTVTYDRVRRLDATEVAQGHHDTVVAATFDSRYLLLPPYDSANVLKTHADELLSHPGERANDAAFGQRLELHFDYWLNQLPLFRNRLTRNARTQISEDAGSAVEQDFYTAEHSGTDHSLAIELRNSAQHFLGPLAFTSIVSQSTPPGPNLTRWTLDVTAWASEDPKIPKALKSAFEQRGAVDIVDMIGNALDSISNITGRFYLANADYLDNTAKRLLCLFDEAYTDTDHPPIVVHLEADQGSHGTIAQILLDPLAAGSLAAATDAARQKAGLPIRWAETESDGLA
jgi:hypothetical protein